MEFSPTNSIVKLCIQGMSMEAQDNAEAATALYTQAWNEATEDLERFISAFYIARNQKTALGKLQWNEIALGLALKINNDTVNTALPVLHEHIAGCYEELGNPKLAKKHHSFSRMFTNEPTGKGPFYHGTKADLKVGDMLTAGRVSNYKSEVTMNHIYFTAMANGAGFAAALAKGEGHERVYVVEPTGGFEHDPNVTNKKFPGNPTLSYRTEYPLKIVGEVTDWKRQTPEQLEKFRNKLDNNKGEIIN